MQQIEKQYDKFETELEKNLGSYIDNYNKKLEESEELNAAEQKSLEELKKQFIVLAEQTIKPTIKNFKNFLESRNQACSMEIKTPMNIDDELPSVIFEIRPPFKRNFALDNHPQLSFQLTRSEKIAVYSHKHMPGAGNSGSEGEFGIDKITSEFVEQKIINLIKDCYDRSWDRL